MSVPTVPMRTEATGAIVPRALRCLLEMVTHPERTTDRLLHESLWPALVVVLGYGVLMSVGFLLSHLERAYPPPPDVLATWTDAYGAFYVLPFVDIAAESYRLILAIAYVPLLLTIWMLMAASARILTVAFGGSASFDQYLGLLAFGFFPFWIVASAVDTIHSGPLDPLVLGALRDEYGPLARQVAVNFMPIAYTILFGLGGAYCALAARRANRFSAWKSAVIGLASFVWPMAASAFLVR